MKHFVQIIMSLHSFHFYRLNFFSFLDCFNALNDDGVCLSFPYRKQNRQTNQQTNKQVKSIYRCVHLCNTYTELPMPVRSRKKCENGHFYASSVYVALCTMAFWFTENSLVCDWWCLHKLTLCTVTSHRPNYTINNNLIRYKSFFFISSAHTSFTLQTIPIECDANNASILIIHFKAQRNTDAER